MVFLTLLPVVCYGCRDDAAEGLSITEAAAGNAVVSTARLEQLVEDPRDVEALLSVTRIYTDLTTLATDGGQISVVANSVSKGVSEPDPLDDCVSVTEDVIRYSDCPVSNGTFDGTITSIEDTLTFDLTIAVRSTGADGSLVVLMRGPIERAGSRLEGELNYETTITGIADFPDGLRLALEARYLRIGLDEVDCPLSGSLVVEQVGGGVDPGAREAVFGPVCGDVRLTE